jgi:hypothetical protein
VRRGVERDLKQEAPLRAQPDVIQPVGGDHEGTLDLVVQIARGNARLAQRVRDEAEVLVDHRTHARLIARGGLHVRRP